MTCKLDEGDYTVLYCTVLHCTCVASLTLQQLTRVTTATVATAVSCTSPGSGSHSWANASTCRISSNYVLDHSKRWAQTGIVLEKQLATFNVISRNVR